MCFLYYACGVQLKVALVIFKWCCLQEVKTLVQLAPAQFVIEIQCGNVVKIIAVSDLSYV